MIVLRRLWIAWSVAVRERLGLLLAMLHVGILFRHRVISGGHSSKYTWASGHDRRTWSLARGG